MANVAMLLGHLPAGVKMDTVSNLSLALDVLMMMSVPWELSAVTLMLSAATLMAPTIVSVEMDLLVSYSLGIH